MNHISPQRSKFCRSNSGLSPFTSSTRFTFNEEDWKSKWRSSEVLPTSDDTDSLGGSEHSSNSSLSLSRTVRDYGERISSLQRENFDLKLRIFLLEERLSVRASCQAMELSDTDIQLDQCKTSLAKCIKLVEEAAQEIQYLETKIETQKTDYEERILNVETELALSQMDVGSPSAPILLEVTPPEMVEVGTETDDIEVSESPGEKDEEEENETSLETTRNVYYDTVQMYRGITTRLESKLRTAEMVWKEVTATINKILSNRKIQANMNLAIFLSEIYRSNLKLRDIFDVSDIYNDME